MSIQTQGADGAGSYVDWDNLNRLFAQMPSGPWDASRDMDGHEIRQIDTDPTNKHHWPFRLCRSIPGQRAACDDAVFDFLAGVLNAWPQISAERSEEAEIERILAMPEGELRKRFLAKGESPEQAATIGRLCFDVASLRAALTRISEQYVTHRGDMTDAEALRAIKSIADAAIAAKASTPAPVATPGVPDSLREAFAAATDSPVFVHDFADPAVSSAPGCQDVSLSFVTPDHITAAFMGNGLAGTIDQARKDAVALAAAWNHVRALIAAQPAGQAGDAGIEATQITLGEGMVDITRIDHEGRTGVLFRPRKERIPFGEPGELPEGTYWPVKGDVVLWVSGEGPGVAIKALADLAPNSTRTGQEKDTFFTSDGFSADLIEAPRSRLPALNSTRTGAAEPCLRAVVEVYSGRTDTRLTFGKGVKHEGGCKAVEQAIIALQAELDQRDACPAAGGPSAGYGGTGVKALSAAILEQCAYPRICSSNGRVAEGIRCGPCERKALAAALAARPEAPSDAGGLATVIAAKAAEIGPIFLDTGKQRERPRIYIASKTAHAPRWRQLRADGLPVISTWIDEAGKGETACFTDLWQRCVDEAAAADAVIVYREPGEVLKGAFVEVGAALAVGTPVYAVGCDEFSFVHHAGVMRCADFGLALALALPTPPSDPAPSGQAEG